MAWLMRLFRSRGFWGSVGLFLLLGLVVAAGAMAALDPTVIMLAIILILVLALAVLAFRMFRAGKASAGIESSIRAQSERDIAAVPPAHRAEVERLRERLEKSIAQLKASKLAGEGLFKSGKRALYALPWYVFIGPPGAGKTTALLNAGLRFPAGTERIAGVGGTRNCDWFLSDQAILLDTAGRYTTEEQDHDEWLAFLDVLKKHRKDQPINGVLVGISLPELLEGSAADVDWHAETVRKRIDELIERLGVRFPVYVVFTKADLLQGFVEFFGEMGRTEREQVWGCTFEPGEAAGERVAEAFGREYDRLQEALLGLRNGRLRHPMKREERHRTYAFPLEFDAARDRLARFVEGLFQPNPYQEEPLFRGFYFTSGTQEGIPIDRVIHAIAERFGLPPHYADAPPPQTETKSYFLKDVFTEVVIPDRGLVRPTGQSVKRARWATTGLGLVALVSLALFVLAASQALVRSRAEIGRVEQTAAEAAAVSWTDTRDVPAELARLDGLRAEVDRLEGGRPLLQLGLDRRGTLRQPAQQLYYRRARDFVEAFALDPIRRSLRTGGDRAAAFEAAALAPPADSLAGDRDGALRRQRVYDDLKAYLLLSDETARLREDEAARAFLKAHLAALAQVGVVGPDTTGRGALAALVARQTDAYVDALVQETAQPFPAEAGLVARARERVYEPPSVAGVYNRIKQEALYTLDPFTLSDAMPGQYLGLFEPGAQVPGAFTQRGWAAVIQPAFERESEDPNRDDWVMGREGAALPPEMQDPDQIRAALYDRYFQEYVRAWQRFLRAVQYRPFGDMGGAAQQLAVLSSSTDSPLLWILAVVTEQTTFRDAAEEGEGEAGVIDQITGRLSRRAEARSGGLVGGRGLPGAGGADGAAPHPVERAFAGLRALNAPEAPAGGASPELYAALEALAQLSSTLQGLAADPAQAADYAAQVLQANGGDLARQLQAVESGTRQLDADVRRSLFVQPVLGAWTDILGAARGHLDQRWREEVYGPYRATLEGRFPLDPRSSQDVPLGDFERFFAPAGGTLATFVEEALAPFLTSDGRSPRSWQGQGIGLSTAARQAIAQAQRIGAGLFTGSTLGVEFEMQADVPAREGDAPPPDQVYARIHGTTDLYRMGSYRPWVTYTWPGSPGAAIGVSTRAGELPPRRAEGDWAIFRLLQDAEIRRSGSTQYAARWTFRQPGQYTLVVRYDLRARSANGPFADPAGFFRFSCPASLN